MTQWRRPGPAGPQLAEALERIATQIRNDMFPPAADLPADCVRCGDTGVIEQIGGDYEIGGTGRTRSVWVTATPEQPIYVGCDCRRLRRTQPDKPREF